MNNNINKEPYSNIIFFDDKFKKMGKPSQKAINVINEIGIISSWKELISIENGNKEITCKK